METQGRVFAWKRKHGRLRARHAGVLPLAVETGAALLGGFGAVEIFAQPVKALPELFGAHAAWVEVNIKERAFVPAARLDDAVFPEQARVKRRAGEGGEDGDLHFVKGNA